MQRFETITAQTNYVETSLEMVQGGPRVLSEISEEVRNLQTTVKPASTTSGSTNTSNTP